MNSLCLPSALSKRSLPALILFGILSTGACISQEQEDVAPDVHIEARVYLTEEGPEAGLLAAPSLVVQTGSVAKYRDTTSFMAPKAYDSPRIPHALSGKIMGGGKLGERKPPRLPVHEHENVIVPPFARDFEKHSTGLDLSFSPVIQEDGSLIVQCTVMQTVLRGFSNHGVPLTMEKPSVFRETKTKTVTLEANRQWRPELLKRSKTVVFSKANFSKPIALEKHMAAPKAPATDPDFAARWLESDVPAITIELTAKRLPAPKQRQAGAPFGQKAQIRLTMKTISTPIPDENAQAVAEDIPNILTENAFANLIATWERRPGIDLLSSPALVTRSGQAGKVEIIREFIYPIAYEPARLENDERSETFPITPVHPIKFETENTGLVYELTPRILRDGSIELDIAHRSAEFQGFLNFGSPIIYRQERRFGSPIPVVLTQNMMETPVFSENEIHTSLRMPTGSTVMLGGIIHEDEQQVEDKVPILGDLPLLGGLGRTSKTITSKKLVHMFVTAELMDEL